MTLVIKDFLPSFAPALTETIIGTHDYICARCSDMLQDSARDRQKGEATPEPQVCGIPFANNPHSMWVYDRETLAFLEINEAAIQKYGYSRAEFLALTIADIRPPEDVAELLQKTRSRGAATGLEVRHRTRDGAIVPVSVTSWQLTFRGRPAELVLARWEDAG